MKPKLLKPGQTILDQKVEHLEMTIVQMQNDLALAHMVLQTHGTFFEMMRRFFRKFEEYEAGQGKKGNDKTVPPVDPLKPEASTSGEGKGK